jgi:ABC-2 type transport system ATP-binding protein
VAIIEHGRIIDIDSPERLVQRHCPERSVVLATDDAAAPARFSGLAQVREVTANNGRLTIHGTGEDLVTAVIDCLAENRIRVTDFRTVVPTLEDVFLRVTGHSIRD